jgi:polyhydroxybutyrate depolymerase
MPRWFRAVLTAAAAAMTLATAGCTLTNAAADSGHAPPRVPRPVPAPTAKTLPPGTRTMHVGHRSFLLYVPSGVRSPAPLVVALGGIGSTSRSEVALFKLTASAKRDRVVVAYPEPVRGTWDAGGCCWGAKANDVRYLSQMRTAIASVIDLDPAKQVLFGFSNGGMLAYDAACADPHWTAIVAFGASLTTRCHPVHTFSITNVNGELDNVAPWDGGYSTYTKTVMPPVWKMDEEFASVFGCTGPRRTTSHGDPIYTYVGCRGGVFVRDIRVPGMRHHWATKKIDGFDLGPVLWPLTLT